MAYHLLRHHPEDVTDTGQSGEMVRVPASEVIRVIDPVEPGQVVRLDPGEEIATPSPPGSGPTYEPFMNLHSQPFQANIEYL